MHEPDGVYFKSGKTKVKNNFMAYDAWWLKKKLMAQLQLGMKIRERSVIVNERLGESLRVKDRDWATAQWHHFVWQVFRQRPQLKRWRRKTRKSSRPHSENGLHAMAVFPMRMTTGRWLFLWLRSSSDHDRCSSGSDRSSSLPSASSSKFISTQPLGTPRWKSTPSQPLSTPRIKLRTRTTIPHRQHNSHTTEVTLAKSHWWRSSRIHDSDTMKWLVRDTKKLDSLFFHCNTTLPLVTIMVGVHSLYIASVDSGHVLRGQLEVKDET